MSEIVFSLSLSLPLSLLLLLLFFLLHLKSFSIMFPRFLTICLIFCETLIFDLDIGSHNVTLVLSREVFLCCWFLASMKNGICVFGSWQHSRRVFLSFLSYHSRRMYRCFTISQQKNVSLLNDSTAERCVVGS